MIFIGDLKALMEQYGISAVNPAGESRCLLSRDCTELLVDDDYDEDAAFAEIKLTFDEAIKRLPDNVIIGVAGMDYDVYVCGGVITLDEEPPEGYERDDEGPVYLDDVTGIIGNWLNRDVSELPEAAKVMLAEAYAICCSALENPEE